MITDFNDYKLFEEIEQIDDTYYTKLDKTEFDDYFNRYFDYYNFDGDDRSRSCVGKNHKKKKDYRKHIKDKEKRMKSHTYSKIKKRKR